MPMSERHKAAARREGKPPIPTKRYEITDPHHKPDLRGQLAGVEVKFESGKQYLYLSDAQARFYIDSGAIKLAQSEE